MNGRSPLGHVPVVRRIASPWYVQRSSVSPVMSGCQGKAAGVHSNALASVHGRGTAPGEKGPISSLSIAECVSVTKVYAPTPEAESLIQPATLQPRASTQKDLQHIIRNP